jgi:hypothetical protein
MRLQVAKQRSGVDYLLWADDGFEVAEALAATKGELLEIGGPSFDGYYFLDGVELPRKLTISNIFEEPFAVERMDERAKKRIDKLVDARDLPYGNDSLGLVMAHYLSYALDDKPHTRKAHQSDKWNIAMNEMAKIILGGLKAAEAKTALRVQFLCEAYRGLESGGLLITDGGLDELQIMQQIGFVPKAILLDGMSMQEAVLQKPTN